MQKSKTEVKSIKKDIVLSNVKENEPLSMHTTLGIGGPARYYYEAKKIDDLIKAVYECQKSKINYLVIGSGSDLLVNDEGFDGMVIVNKIVRLTNVDGKFTVGAGTILQDFINFTIEKGYAGLEKLSGIPGTVGGAVYGNAGAYGQSISDHLEKVTVFDGTKRKIFKKDECKFDYRESVFKKNKFSIIELEFNLEKGQREFLKKISLDTILLRSQKYGPGIKCPGSFFKNIVVKGVKPKVLKLIPPDKIVYGKIPAGYLMEAVGAKGVQKGSIKIAEYHGNLIINMGGGTAKEFLDLANFYAGKVQEKFGITMEPEVQLIGFKS